MPPRRACSSTVACPDTQDSLRSPCGFRRPSVNWTPRHPNCGRNGADGPPGNGRPPGQFGLAVDIPVEAAGGTDDGRRDAAADAEAAVAVALRGDAGDDAGLGEVNRGSDL